MAMTMRRTVTGTLLMLGIAVSAGAQETQRAVPALVREAQELLIAAYPELREGRLTWRIVPTETGVVVEVRPQTVPIETTPSAPLVAATVEADEQGRVQALRADGALIAAARLKAANPTTRAKFPPDDPTAVETLVPAGLQTRLGAPTLRERTFVADGAPDEAQTWRVDVESTETVPQRYTLVFEPVDGRLLSVVRR